MFDLQAKDVTKLQLPLAFIKDVYLGTIHFSQGLYDSAVPLLIYVILLIKYASEKRFDLQAKNVTRLQLPLAFTKDSCLLANGCNAF